MNWSGFMNSQKRESKFSLGKITRQQWLVLLLVGVLLAVMALPVKKEDSGSKKTAESVWTQSDGDTQYTPREQMERKLEEILSQVEGVGQVKVLLSVKEGEGDTFYGESQTFVVEGVLIVAEGVGNSVVERNIQQAVMALFPVEAHKIKIMKMI